MARPSILSAITGIAYICHSPAAEINLMESEPTRWRARRTLLLETNGCILLIASYSLLRNLCHIRALEDCFHDVSILSGNEKSNTGQSDRSNRMIWGFC